MFIAINTIFISLNAQNAVIEVKMHVTKSSDIQNSQLLAIKEKVHVDQLKMAMDSNYSIIGDTLKVHLSFFDVKAFGPLELNTPFSLNEETYVTQWKQHYSVGNHILFLFMNEGDGYEFKKLEISDPLKQKHLFPEVMNFIREHLPSGNEEVVDDGTRFLANAIMPVWTSDRKNTATNLVHENRYKNNHINFFHGNFKYGFFDLIPADSNTVENMKLINSIYTDENDEDHWFFSDLYIYSNSNNIDGYDPSKVKDWPISIEESDTIYIIYDKFIYNLLTYIENSDKHDSNQKVSDWSWEYVNRLNRRITNLSEMSDRNSNDKLILKFDESSTQNEGSEIPILSPVFNNTWCNVFASDMTRQILFPGFFSSNNSNISNSNYAPWGPHNYASKIHDVLNTGEGFSPVGFGEAWNYTNAGYIVYLTAYNWRYYAGLAGKYDYSGHIATCYPTQNYENGSYLNANIIQAGGTTNITQLNQVWTNINNVQARIYLEYILKL
ncbi:hypothetical protein L21SP5_00146 [Salinivirga cyanobacteriivorans]|uniref:Uncharacterized protein n=2 Tax=Salinivirga cyanobacteriivorans TaxID=1307839 RepID=A0A0S2HUU1_9BACT|nr:hypothetical protein L21SP5_00146 [Salinivirga cyanobacteriivorans]